MEGSREQNRKEVCMSTLISNKSEIKCAYLLYTNIEGVDEKAVVILQARGEVID